MHYELYLDSLFLLNFGMNLLLLCLVDHSMGHTATWYRLLAGAGVGAVWYLFPFLWKGTAAGKLLLCFLPGTILMLYVTFHIRSLGTLWNYFRKLMLSTFLIGGILAALLRGFPMGRNYLPGIGMTLGVGAFSGWILVWGRKKEAEQSCYCEVVLQGAEGPLRIHALVDSGNTLTEPISGAPVSVLDARIFYRLWPEGLPGFRVIPYHSVGKKSGILKGYPVPQMTLIQQGVEREYRNVYLAVSEEEIVGEEIPMLLPPALLQETNKARRKKEKIKEPDDPARHNVADRSKYGLKDYIGGAEVLPPPLPSEQENQVIGDLGTEYEDEAKAILIEHNLRLVVYIAKKFDNTGVGVEDLISIGTIGLIKSINTFNPEKNIKLATYASRCIENEILMYLRRNNKTKMEVSIDEPLNVDWDGNELLLSDILGTDEDVIYRGIENEVERKLLMNAVSKLSKREKTIVRLRFGLGTVDGQEMTQKEVANLLGISQSYISRLEKKIMRQLKKEISLHI